MNELWTELFVRFHSHIVETIPLCSDVVARSASFGSSAPGWLQKLRRVMPYKKKPQIIPLLLDKATTSAVKSPLTTKLPHECKSVSLFSNIFHNKLLKSATARVKAVAIMLPQVRIIMYRATSYLAHNNDNFPFLLKMSSIHASWCLSRWECICGPEESSEKPVT